MSPRSRTNRFCLAFSGLLLCVFTGAFGETPQEHVHGNSHAVMPFDLSRTVHVFTMTVSGGIERVVAKDAADAVQVTLIRQHLRKEAERFSKGDYSDPAALHGANMPGLDDLRAGAKRVRVSYSELPDGAQITFTTTDLRLLTAIHRWFGAQLSEHGADARAG